MNLEKLLEDKISPALVGFYQAAGIVAYTVLVALVITMLDGSGINPPEIIAVPSVLTLLVLSAGITGTLVFGLPVYFTFAKNKVGRAIAILGYTFLYLFVAVLIIGSIVLIASPRGVSNFKECVAAGNPAMESYPRRCSTDGETFTEELD